MTGQEIFDKYQDEDPEYSQTLYSARMIVADDEAFFKQLESAEETGKRVGIVENNLNFSEPSEIFIIQ